MDEHGYNNSASGKNKKGFAGFKSKKDTIWPLAIQQAANMHTGNNTVGDEVAEFAVRFGLHYDFSLLVEQVIFFNAAEHPDGLESRIDLF